MTNGTERERWKRGGAAGEQQRVNARARVNLPPPGSFGSTAKVYYPDGRTMSLKAGQSVSDAEAV